MLARRSEFAIDITFPRQKWISELASILRFMYMAFLVLIFFIEICEVQIPFSPTLIEEQPHCSSRGL